MKDVHIKISNGQVTAIHLPTKSKVEMPKPQGVTIPVLKDQVMAALTAVIDSAEVKITRTDGHTTSSYIYEGTYPEKWEAARAKRAIHSKCKGTFGGRIEAMKAGRFSYIGHSN